MNLTLGRRMMKRRLIILYVALTFIVAGLLSFAAFHYITQLYRSETEVRLMENTLLIKASLDNNPLFVQKETMDDLALFYHNMMTKQLGSDNKEYAPRVTFIRDDGLVLGDSETDSSLMANHADRPEVISSLQNGTGKDERYSATLGVPFLYYSQYFKDENLIIRLAMPLMVLKTITIRIVQVTLLGIFGSLVLSGLLSYFLSRYVTSPLTKLNKQLEAIPENDYKRRVMVTNDTELGPLAKSVNLLAENLEETMLSLADHNIKMDTIIESLQSGLTAVDPHMKLLIINPVFYKLFNLKSQDQAIGKPAVQIIRNHTLLDMLEESMASNSIVKREIVTYESGKRILEAIACPILPLDDKTKNTGAIVHVTDVTAVRKLEEMRSEFVSNVSHELKTPLTSIRGFIETLRDGAMKDAAVAEKFLDIIDIEADRLGILINDILILSEIERFHQEPDSTEFQLKPLLIETIELVRSAVNDKGIDVIVDVSDDFSLKANRNRIKQLLLNLLDNAVKYNVKDGKITISAVLKPDGHRTVMVSDTGIGIPEEYQTRIFERFYRIDKGRSRENGGTGLGLSIVKHIAQLYGGYVEVESEYGKGSTFSVTI